MNQEEIHVLAQYINALEDAAANLEAALLRKDIQAIGKAKKFILEVKTKIDILLK